MSCTACTLQTDIKTSIHGITYGENCSTMIHDKRSVFDWLANVSLPSNQEAFDVFEVRFKNGRKEFYRNVNKLSLYTGDAIAVEVKSGHDIGTISMSGELVKLQLAKNKVGLDSPEIKKIYRKANQRDIDIWKKSREKEAKTQKEGRLIISKLGLKMKLSDVEYQGDGKKATFYYTAESRVDFRQLIRDFAAAFHIRVEMKQVDYRNEAARLGGVASCGRELCCSTWLTDFRRVNTQAARYQQLSLNPDKLQGQCGRLKCCLNFELDSYKDALKGFPNTKRYLETESGKARFIKMDIFKGLLWYAYVNSEDFKWYQLTIEQVNEILERNRKGDKASSLAEIEVIEEIKKISFEDAVGEDNISRFDKPKRNNKRRNKKRRNTNSNTKNKKQNKQNNKKQHPNQKKKPQNNKQQHSNSNKNKRRKRKPRNNSNNQNKNNQNKDENA